MNLGIAGRTYVVLGGSRGIGWETVRLLAEEGANAIVISRKPAAVAHNAEALASRYGVTIEGIAADASVPGEVEAAIDASISRVGPLSGMAVTNHWMGQARKFANIDDDEWNAYFQNSLMAVVRASRIVLPHLASQGGGSVVLTSAFSSRAPKAYIPAYAAFKAALNNLTKSLAKTYGPAGVRVNAVAPGAIRTGRYDERMALLRREKPDIDCREAERRMFDAMEMTVALERIGKPSEVADMIVFLLSERAAYTTGLIANVDGGTDF